MLTSVDAVHGSYYLLMWPIVHTFGTAELVLRLPSRLSGLILALFAAAPVLARRRDTVGSASRPDH